MATRANAGSAMAMAMEMAASGSAPPAPAATAVVSDPSPPPPAAAMTAMASASLPPSADATYRPPQHAHAHAHTHATPPQSPAALRRFSAGKGKTGRQSSKFGTVNYSVDEMRRLNETVRAVMPVAGEDWLHVAYKFNYLRPESIPYREVDSLKRKFKKMYCSRVRSGTGTGAGGSTSRLPDYIEHAKELRRLIHARSDKAQLDAAASDSPSELDAHDVVSGSESHAASAPASAPVGLNAKPEALGADASAEQQASLARASGASSNDTEHLTAGAKAATCSQSDAAPALLLGSPHDVASAAEPPLTTSAAESDANRPLSANPSGIEDEYRRASASRRPAVDLGDSVASPLPLAPSSAPLSFSELLAATVSGPPQSTSSIIAMLQQSIERKRRSIADEALSESERVRKERKKRKMEHVLRTIHHEQLAAAGAAGLDVASASASVGTGQTLAGSGGAPFTAEVPYYTVAATSASATGSSEPLASASLGVLEVVLQFLVAQQREHAAQLERERERREREQQLKAQRRRAKERRRQQEMRHLVRAVAAALGDRCPESLKQSLAAPSTGSSDGDDTDDDNEHDTEGGGDDSSADRTAVATQSVAQSEGSATALDTPTTALL